MAEEMDRPNLTGMTSMLSPRLHPNLKHLTIRKDRELVGYAEYYSSLHLWFNSLDYVIEALYVKQTFEK